MSESKPSGLKQPSRIGRPCSAQLPKPAVPPSPPRSSKYNNKYSINRVITLLKYACIHWMLLHFYPKVVSSVSQYLNSKIRMCSQRNGTQI